MKLGLPQDRRILIWVGTMFDFSGLEILVKAAPKICNENDEVDFIIIGDGPKKKDFMKMAEENGVFHRMRFTGYIQNSNLNQWLSACDLALAPYNKLRLSQEDFTSYKIFEYLACGLPVVTSYLKGDSNIRYIPEFDLGATAPPGDEDAFTAAVLKILAKGSYFNDDFVLRARETLRKLDVSWDSLVEHVDDLCRSVVKSSRCTAYPVGN